MHLTNTDLNSKICIACTELLTMPRTIWLQFSGLLPQNPRGPVHQTTNAFKVHCKQNYDKI